MYQNQANEYGGLKTVTATFGIIVAAVVGYYFGQRPAEAAEMHAREAADQTVEYKSTLDSEIKGNIEHINSEQERDRQLRDSYRDMIKKIDELIE
jgi:Na+/glutamate symporter